MDVVLQRWELLFQQLRGWLSPQSTSTLETSLSNSAHVARQLAIFLSAGLTPTKALSLVNQPTPQPATPEALVHYFFEHARQVGAAPAHTMQSVATALTEAADTVRLAQAYQAGPRSAQRIMMALPFFSLFGALVLGQDVLRVLVTSALGWFLLLSAAALIWIAHVWSTRMINQALRFSWFNGMSAECCAMYVVAGLPLNSALEKADAFAQPFLVSQPECHDDRNEIVAVIDLAHREGIPVAGLLRAHADQQRSVAQQQLRFRVERLSVQLVLPLGVCILPAFIAVGIIPIVISMLSSTSLGS
jgi:tight adherence protein B